MEFNTFIKILHISKLLSNTQLSVYDGIYKIGDDKKNIKIKENRKTEELEISFYNVSVQNYPLKNIRATAKDGVATIYIPLKDIKTKGDAEKIISWLINDCLIEKTGNGIFNKILRFIGKFF